MQGRHAFFLIAAGAFCLAAAFIAATLLLSSCSSRLSASIGSDGGAKISVLAEVPATLSAKLRRLIAAGGGAGSSSVAALPFFDVEAVRSSVASRPSLSLISISRPSPDSLRLELSVRSLAELAASPDFRDSDLIAYSQGSGWKECRIRLAREGAKDLASVLPGLDPALMEALSPPALEEDPLSPSEYRTMLKGVLGEKAMTALESAAISLSLTAPGPVLASEGGKLSGSTLSASIPLIDALVLEKDIVLRLRWKTTP